MTTVLIVEDHPHHMALAATLLEMNGYAVLKAGNAADGIDLARAHRPDLILMDIQMPGMDGLTAIRHLRADPLTQAIKIIALTAYFDDYSDEGAMADGANAFLAKPYHHQDFLNTVREVLARG